MAASTPALVDIVREFLAVDAALSGLIQRYRQGELRFEEVQAIVSDSEECALFRLKERCHTLFREGRGPSRVARHREVLFDLAVGSLFHEAMKFRENFYQREVYGPRVRALRDEAGEQAELLFEEFEKIQVAASDRIEEGLQETEALLARTLEQLEVLLAEHAADGHVARFLIERRPRVEEVFGGNLEGLFERIHGASAAGFGVAARSYLASGYFDEAVGAFGLAVEHGGDAAGLASPTAYARGMASYLRGDYAKSVRELERWAEGESKPEPDLLELAHSALARVPDLVRGEPGAEVSGAASKLVERLARLRKGPTPSTS